MTLLVRSTAVTARVRSLAAGHFGVALAVPLPAAATTSTLRSTAYWIAAVSDGLSSSPPRERLITFAPESTAKRTDFETSLESPDPSESNALIGKIRTCGATPAPPMPLSAAAAMIPATCVP